eukprot:TRINITY_DN1677_c0_g1_i3.p1 TRINITY_DN1677_c0_g1~~TRINITY_DN1677_c0_g1_i3.p1  ORF type:complete len:259 (+),score=49.61 TRINITY_DN1677_c0_g1_i3:35-811(+)
MSLSKKVAVITGASSGIGYQTALLFAKEGASVVLADINEEAGRKAKEEICRIVSNPKAALFVLCNVTKRSDLQAAIQQAQQHFGSFDIMVNNAGISLSQEGITDGDDAVKWKLLVDINFTAVIEGTQLAINHFREFKKNGVVINTSSTSALSPLVLAPVYSATKAGVLHFTLSLADIGELYGIKVTAICPTFTDTNMLHQHGEDYFQSLKDMYGIISPETVAKGMLQLTSKETPGGTILLATQKGLKHWKPRYAPSKL